MKLLLHLSVPHLPQAAGLKGIKNVMSGTPLRIAQKLYLQYKQKQHGLKTCEIGKGNFKKFTC